MLSLLPRCLQLILSEAKKSDKKSYSNLILKLTVSICYGIFIGFIVDKLIFSQLPTNLPVNWSFLVLCLSCLLGALLCQFSVQFRCLSFLVWLELFGRAGRKVVKALLFILILTGPIENIIANSKEVARVFGCTSYLTYNLTRTKVDLALKPFTHAFAHMDLHLSDVEGIFHEIKGVLQPIIHEVEHVFDKQ